MAIKSRKMSLEEKISCLKKIKTNGIDLKNISKDFVTDDGIIVNNVMTNLKKYYQKNQLSIKQIMECENLGIEFPSKQKALEDKIAFLEKAKEEEISFPEITQNYEKYSCTSVYQSISDLRNAYQNRLLTEEQEEICINDLKIIIPNEEKKAIVMQKIREGALKNIIFREEIQKKLILKM